MISKLFALFNASTKALNTSITAPFYCTSNSLTRKTSLETRRPINGY